MKASAPRAVIHLAAVIPPACYDNPGLAEKVNVGATRHLTSAVAAHAPSARFVHASSVAVHGSRNPYRGLGLLGPDTPLAPSDLYGRHKAAAEEVVRALGTPWVVLRLGGVMTTEVGQSDQDTSYFSAALPDDGRIQTVDVRDVARAFAAAVAVAGAFASPPLPQATSATASVAHAGGGSSDPPSILTRANCTFRSGTSPTLWIRKVSDSAPPGFTPVSITFGVNVAAAVAAVSPYSTTSERELTKASHSPSIEYCRRGDRAADCAALEMLCGGNFTGGSNPPLSVYFLLSP